MGKAPCLLRFIEQFAYIDLLNLLSPRFVQLLKPDLQLLAAKQDLHQVLLSKQLIKQKFESCSVLNNNLPSDQHLDPDLRLRSDPERTLPQ